jgi:hypothetical protein
MADDIAARTEQVHDALKNSGDSLLVELDLRSNDLVSKIDDAGSRLSERVLTSGEKANEVIDVTVNSLVAKVVDQTEATQAELTARIQSFDELLKERGADLAERFARDSGTLGALITRHIAEFDRTVKTHGGDIVERMGQRTQEISDTLKNYVDTFDSKVATKGREITGALDARFGEFQELLDTRVTTLDLSLDTRIKNLDQSIETHLSSVTGALTEGSTQAIAALDKRIADVSATINERSQELADTVSSRFQDAHQNIDVRGTAIVGEISRQIVQIEDLLGTRVEAAANRVDISSKQIGDMLIARSDELAQTIKARAEDAERTLMTVTASASDSLQYRVREAETALVNATSTVDTRLRASTNEMATQLAATSDKLSTTLRQDATDIERAIIAAATNISGGIAGKISEVVTVARQRTDELTQLIDDKRGLLVTSLDSKGQEIAGHISRATDDAVKSISGTGLGFAETMQNNGTEVARLINSASEVATGAVNRSLKEIQETTRGAIEQSRQVASASVTEMQETSKMLRTDTLALFERLREGNILLQEVLTGAHENLSKLESTLVSRVATFVSTVNEMTAKNGAASDKVQEQLSLFNTKTRGVLDDLSGLSQQFDAHGRAIVEAAALIEHSNRRTNESVDERRSMLDQLITTLDLRAADLDQRLTRFTSLLDDSMEAAEARARDIARVVAESATASTTTIGRQFEAVRSSVEEERRLTAEAMREIYEQGTQEAETMFKHAAGGFSSIIHNMKQMAADMQRELEATRAELRRGVLEMPQEAAESTAQMRKVIVDQIEALAELNRIVARHGRNAEPSPMRAAPETVAEPRVATVGVRAEAPPRVRGRDTTTALPPPDLGVGPSVSPGRGNDGWLSDVLTRAEPDAADRTAPRPGNPLDALTLDIARLIDRDMASEMWARYQRGERKAFTKRLYTAAGQKAFDEVSRKYRSDRAFKQTVDRYITEFERLLDDVSRDDRSTTTLRNYLTSESGLVYTLLAHAAGRLG